MPPKKRPASVVEDVFEESGPESIFPSVDMTGSSGISPIIDRPSSDFLSDRAAAGALPSGGLSGLRPANIVDKKKDQREREKVVTFRCIPARLKRELDKISLDYEIPLGVLASFIFESSLQDFENGKLALNPEMTNSRWSLYREENRRKLGRPPGGGVKGGRKTGEGKNTAFRGVSLELRDRIRALARRREMHNVPAGEIARALLEHGVKHIKNGHWKLR